MQTILPILPYSRQSAPIPVVCTVSPVAATDTSNKKKVPSAHPSEWLETRKSLLNQICFRHRSRCLAVSDESPPPDEHDKGRYPPGPRTR